MGLDRGLRHAQPVRRIDERWRVMSEQLDKRRLGRCQPVGALQWRWPCLAAEWSVGRRRRRRPAPCPLQAHRVDRNGCHGDAIGQRTRAPHHRHGLACGEIAFGRGPDPPPHGRRVGRPCGGEPVPAHQKSIGRIEDAPCGLIGLHDPTVRFDNDDRPGGDIEERVAQLTFALQGTQVSTEADSPDQMRRQGLQQGDLVMRKIAATRVAAEHDGAHRLWPRRRHQPQIRVTVRIPTQGGQ